MARVDVDLRLQNRQFMRGLRQTQQSISTTQLVLGGFLANLATGALTGFATAASSAFRSVFRSAVNIERTRAQFTALVGDADLAREALERVTRFAADTPFETADVERAGVQLLAFGTRAEDLTDRLMQLGNVAGVSNRNIGEIATIFGQINAQGRLTAERLNQLTDAGINLNDALAGELNISVSELRDTISRGGVSAEQFNRAFRALGDRLDGTNRLSMTLGGAISGLNSQIEEAVRVIGEGLAPIFSEIARDLTNLIKVNRELIVQFGSDVYEFARSAYDGIKNAIAATLSFIERFRTENMGLIETIGMLGENLNELINTRFVEFRERISALFEVLEPLIDVLGEAFSLALRNANRLIQLFTLASTANTDALRTAMPVIDGIRIVVQILSDAISILIGYYESLSVTIFNFVRNVFGFFQQFGRNTEIIWNDIQNTITAAFIGIAASANRFYAGFVRAISPIESFTRRLFASVVDSIRNPIATVIDGLVNIIENLLKLPLGPFRDEVETARDALMGASMGLRTFDSAALRTNTTLLDSANAATMTAERLDNLAASIQNAEMRTVSFNMTPITPQIQGPRAGDESGRAEAERLMRLGSRPRTTPRGMTPVGGGPSLGGAFGDEPTIGGGSAQAAFNNEILRQMQLERLEIVQSGLAEEDAFKLQNDVLLLQRQEDFVAAQKRIDEAAAADLRRRQMDQFFQFKSIEEAKVDFQRLTESQKVDTVQTGLGAISALTRTETGALFEVGKAAAKAEAVINAYRAANAAYASLAGIPIVGPALGVAAAAAAVLSGIRNVEAINRQQPGFQLGGSVSGSNYSGDNVLIRANSGESVLTRNQQGDITEALDNTPVVQAINRLNARMNEPLLIVNSNGQVLFETIRDASEDGFGLGATG